MKYLNNNTKKAKDLITRYERAEKGDIYTVYKKPSTYKVRAYGDILNRDIILKHKAKYDPHKAIIDFWGYKIIGANFSHFTLARIMAVSNKETGELDSLWLVVDTPTKQYRINLDKSYIK